MEAKKLRRWEKEMVFLMPNARLIEDERLGVGGLSPGGFYEINFS